MRLERLAIKRTCFAVRLLAVLGASAASAVCGRLAIARTCFAAPLSVVLDTYAILPTRHRKGQRIVLCPFLFGAKATYNLRPFALVA